MEDPKKIMPYEYVLLLERIEKLETRNKYNHSNLCDDCKRIEKLEDTINRLTLLNDCQWINVKERLPNDYNGYLCFLWMNDQGEYTGMMKVLFYDFKNGKWCDNDPSACIKDPENYLSNWNFVTHWMPLPKEPNI